MTQPIKLPEFTAQENLEGALTAALEETLEALHSYEDAGLDHPFIKANILSALSDLGEARDYLRIAQGHP